MKSLESRSFHLLRWLKGSARDLRGTQAAHSKKKVQRKFWPRVRDHGAEERYLIIML